MTAHVTSFTSRFAIVEPQLEDTIVVGSSGVQHRGVIKGVVEECGHAVKRPALLSIPQTPLATPCAHPMHPSALLCFPQRSHLCRSCPTSPFNMFVFYIVSHPQYSSRKLLVAINFNGSTLQNDLMPWHVGTFFQNKTRQALKDCVLIL